MKRKCTLLLLLTSLFFQLAIGQNCTVNAGVPSLQCKDNIIILNGTIAGLYNPASVTWTQIAGTSLGISNPNSLSATTPQLTVAGASYTFRLTATCQDGITVSNDVIYNVAANTPAPPAHSGGNIAVGCLQYGQSIVLAGAVPPPGFTGTWIIAKKLGDLPTHGGTFSDIHDPNATFTPVQPGLPGDPGWECVPNTGTYRLQWSWQSNTLPPPECTSAQTSSVAEYNVSMALYNAVDARHSCVGPIMQLYGTCPGNGTSSWSLVSGPPGYSFATVNLKDVTLTGLPAGDYTFRYTVSGACVNGTKDVGFTVPAGIFTPLTTANANAGNIQTSFCSGFPASVQLSANIPAVGETGTWLQLQGSAPVTFSDIHDPYATITNFSPGGSRYVFRWVISNAGGCSSFSDIQLIAPVSITPLEINSTQLCNTSTLQVLNNLPVNCNKRKMILALNRVLPASNFPRGAGWYLEKMELVSKPTGSPATLGITTKSHFVYGTTPNSSISQVSDCNGLYAVVQDDGCETLPICRVRISEMGIYEPYVPGIYTGSLIMKNIFCGQEISFPFRMVVGHAPTAANAGTDQNLACNVTQTFLAGNDPLVSAPFYGKGTWSQVSGPNTAVFADKQNRSSQVSSLIPGTYSFMWRIQGGDFCSDNQDLVTVRVSNTPPAAVTAGADRTVCFGTPVTLTADLVPSGNISTMLDNTGSTGSWTLVSGPAVTIISPNSPVTQTSSLAANSIYVFRYTAMNLCGSTQADVTITTSNTQGPVAVSAGADACLAAGTNSFNISGTLPGAGQSGIWTKTDLLQAGNFAAPAAATTTYDNVITPGTYGLIWTITQAGCPNSVSDTVYISNQGPPSPASARPDLDTCLAPAGNTFQLYATPPAAGTGRWTQLTGPPGAVFNAAISNPMVTIAEPGLYTFRWTVSSGTCGVTTDDVRINVNNSPSLAETLTPDTLLCTTNQFTIRAVTPLSGTGRWQVVSFTGGPPTLADPNSASTLLTVSPGTTVLRWNVTSDKASCPGSNKLVTVSNNPVANAKNDIAACMASGVLLSSSSPGAGTGVWSVITQPGGSPPVTFMRQGNDSTYAVSPLVQGTYNLRWTVTGAGCGNSFDDRVVQIDNIIPPSAGADFCGLTAGPLLLSGSAVPPGGNVAWTLFSKPALAPAGSFSAPGAPVTTYSPVTPGGTYNFEYRLMQGACAISDYVQVRAVPAPQADAAPLYCDNPAGLNLLGNDPFPGSGSWSLVSAPAGAGPLTWTNQNTPTANVRGLAPGNYTFRYSINDIVCGNSFSDVTVASTCYTLPATISNFSATDSQCKTVLKWTSVEETGFSRYEIEFSRTGTGYQTAAILPGKGNYQAYSFVHPAGGGTTFYRLKIIDLDGRYTYSQVVTVRNDCNKAMIVVYPVPADKQLIIVSTGSDMVKQAALWSADGKLVRRLLLQPGKNTINTSQLANGVYTLTVEEKNEIPDKYKLIVQH